MPGTNQGGNQSQDTGTNIVTVSYPISFTDYAVTAFAAVSGNSPEAANLAISRLGPDKMKVSASKSISSIYWIAFHH